MVTVDEAKAAFRRALSPLPGEDAPLERAHGRILTAPVLARMNQPPFDSSAMDGYAVRLDDVRKEGARLKLAGVSSAGERFGGALPPGAAVRIFTGAPVPDGADHILIQEHAERIGDEVIVKVAAGTGQHIRPLGVDFREGDRLLAAGARLSGPALALAAAGGAASVSVRRRPRVALIANGDELVLPGKAPGPDQIVCSIPYGLSPMIEEWGGEAMFLGIASDDIASIRKLAEKALDCDLIVPIGGASVGDRDYMRAAFAEIGFSLVFEKVSVKPGKPTWFGVAGKSAVLGLPGNPASALVTAVLFLKTAIGRFLGRGEEEIDDFLPARAAKALPENGPRETYLRARLTTAADGARLAAPFDNQDSSLLSVMARSDVLIRRSAGAPAARPGDILSCLPL
jgi:molybdopterin molybdotransferase